MCEDARGECDGKSSEVNAGTPPPSKKMKDGNKPDEPIEGQSSNFEFKLKTQFHVCILVVVELYWPRPPPLFPGKPKNKRRSR